MTGHGESRDFRDGLARAAAADALPEIILSGGPRDGETDIRTAPLPPRLELSAIGMVGILSGYAPFGPSGRSSTSTGMRWSSAEPTAMTLRMRVAS